MQCSTFYFLYFYFLGGEAPVASRPIPPSLLSRISERFVREVEDSRPKTCFTTRYSLGRAAPVTFASPAAW